MTAFGLALCIWAGALMLIFGAGYFSARSAYRETRSRSARAPGGSRRDQSPPARRQRRMWGVWVRIR